MSEPSTAAEVFDQFFQCLRKSSAGSFGACGSLRPGLSGPRDNRCAHAGFVVREDEVRVKLGPSLVRCGCVEFIQPGSISSAYGIDSRKRKVTHCAIEVCRTGVALCAPAPVSLTVESSYYDFRRSPSPSLEDLSVESVSTARPRRY